jgi:hypothetical protein
MKDKSMTEKAEAYDYLINLFKIFTMLGISFGLFQLFRKRIQNTFLGGSIFCKPKENLLALIFIRSFSKK